MIEIKGPLPAETAPVPAISGAVMFLAREHYWALGGLDSGYFLHVEDLDFCASFSAAGGEVCLVPQVKVHHCRSSSEVGRFFVEWHKIRGFRRYFRKQGLGSLRRGLLEAALLARLAVIVMAIPFSREQPRGSRSGFGGS
jgi:GT2 family glycosyltransferase